MSAPLGALAVAGFVIGIAIALVVIFARWR
jgi:hypothetical protein